MICTSPSNNKKQVTKRLPQLINITEDRAAAIYDFCCEVKHAAAPSLLFSQDIHSLDPRDHERHEAVMWLEDSLRELCSKAFESRTFADELADAKVLEANYRV
jgi:negative regulator of sigma E activity